MTKTHNLYQNDCRCRYLRVCQVANPASKHTRPLARSLTLLTHREKLLHFTFQTGKIVQLKYNYSTDIEKDEKKKVFPTFIKQVLVERRR